MKNSLKLLIISLILLNIMLNINLFYPKNALADTPLEASEIVIEKSTGRVLFENNSNIKRGMASTTKILTAITIINNCNLSDEVLITKDVTQIEGSSIYLKEGERLKVIDLLYGLMLRSGNDCACALAKYASGSIDNFAKLMNITAKSFGVNNSCFTNPHGLSDKNHYTTAHDLAIITAKALENDVFKEIVSCKKYTCVNGAGETRVFYNKNKMLTQFDGADGVKTGFTKDAGRCLVSSATRGGMQLICVVLGCAPMFERSKELLQECFNCFSIKNVVENNKPLGYIEVEGGLLENPYKLQFYCKNGVNLPLKDGELKDITIEYDIPETLRFPVKNDIFLGNLNVLIGNNLIYSEKLYIIGEKCSYTFSESFFGTVKRWNLYEN